MKKTLKAFLKTTALILAITLVFAMLSACGSTNNDGGNVSNPGGSNTSEPSGGNTSNPGGSNTSEPGGNNGGKPTILTVWTKDRADSEYMVAAVERYNETNTHNYIVEYQIYSDNYPSAINLAFQNGEAPDIMVFQEQMFRSWVNAGKYADLKPFMDEEYIATFGSNLYEGINEIDGKIYYVPTANTINRLFYNTEIFARCGMDGPPTTLTEMVEDAKIITEKLSGEGIYGFAANMKSPTSAMSRSLDRMTETSFGIHNGYDFKTGRYDFTSLTPIIEIWQDLMSPACAFPGCESLDIDPLRTQFADGKIGMYISFTHAEPGVYQNQFPMDSSKWAVAPIPSLTSEMVGANNFTAMNGYCLNADSDHLEDAWVVYRELFADIDLLAGYYSAGLGISMVPAAIEKATPAECYTNNPALLVSDTDIVWPNTPQQVNGDAVVVEGQNYYDVFATLIWNNSSAAEIDTALQDLTDRYNAALQRGLDEGLIDEIVNPNFNPKNPVM